IVAPAKQLRLFDRLARNRHPGNSTTTLIHETMEAASTGPLSIESGRMVAIPFYEVLANSLQRGRSRSRAEGRRGPTPRHGKLRASTGPLSIESGRWQVITGDVPGVQ